MKKICAVLFIVTLMSGTGCSPMREEEDNPVPLLPASDAHYVNTVAGHLLAGRKLVQTSSDRLSGSAVQACNREAEAIFSSAHIELGEIAAYFNFTITANVDSFFADHASMLRSAEGHEFDSLYLSLQVDRHDALLQAFAAQLLKPDPDLLRNHASKYIPIINQSKEMAAELQ